MNGILIPEITVMRGVNYTFEVYGGNNSEKSAQYHPFYITDDAEGGYAQKTDEQKGVSFLPSSKGEKGGGSDKGLGMISL